MTVKFDGSWITGDSFWKRALAVYGYAFVGGLMFWGPIVFARVFLLGY